METTDKTIVTVEALVKVPVAKVWEYWSAPQHVTQWCQASEDWHAPYAENDLRTGGKFKTTMAAKDGSFSFDFEGVYTNVQVNNLLEYEMADGRRVKILFTDLGSETQVVESFEAESTNPVEMQKGGWQAILNNFKKYAEAHA